VKTAPLVDDICLTSHDISGTEVVYLRGSAPSLNRTKFLEKS
jgi:hypothetical protein